MIVYDSSSLIQAPKIKEFYLILRFLPMQAGEVFFDLCTCIKIYLKLLSRFQICLVYPIMLLRRQNAICLMSTPTVIKYPYILEYCGLCLFIDSEMLPIQPSLLLLPPEVFHQCMILAVLPLAHIADKSPTPDNPADSTGFHCRNAGYSPL